MCSGHPIGRAAGGQDLPCFQTAAVTPRPRPRVRAQRGCMRSLEKKWAQDVRGKHFPLGRKRATICAGGAEEMTGGTGTCKTGRWLNSFRLASSAGPDQRTSWKYSELKASDISLRGQGTGQAEPAAAGGGAEAQQSWSCRRCRERFAGPWGADGRTLPGGLPSRIN